MYFKAVPFYFNSVESVVMKKAADITEDKIESQKRPECEEASSPPTAKAICLSSSVQVIDPRYVAFSELMSISK